MEYINNDRIEGDTSEVLITINSLKVAVSSLEVQLMSAILFPVEAARAESSRVFWIILVT